MLKFIVDNMFKRIRHGGLAVQYWDGEEIHYGDIKPASSIIFNKQPSLLAAAADPMLTLGEYYMDEVIDYAGSLDDIIRTFSINSLLNSDKLSLTETLLSTAKLGLDSFTEKLTEKENIHAHYDLGNQFFSLWLDDTMNYSCAYFQSPDDTLGQAQRQKINLILKKLRLRPHMRLLDIGCGWGSLILQAAKQYGVKVMGITLSEEQLAEVTKRIDREGLGHLVDVKLLNYQDIDPAKYQFDRIVSVGMFEHVGRSHLANYMAKIHDLLVPGGISLLHTLTSLREGKTNAWSLKYIFPGGYVPSLRETIALLPDYDYHVLLIESLRRHYVKTLEHWYNNFNLQIDKIRHMFDQRFIRMWSLYLQGSAAILRTGHLDVHQILFSKGLADDLPLTLNDVYAD